MIPVRCFTCNNVLGNLYRALNEADKIDETFFHTHQINNYCCRKVLSTQVDIYRNSFMEHDQSFYTLKKNSEVEIILTTK